MRCEVSDEDILYCIKLAPYISMTESGLSVDELVAYGRISNAVDNVGCYGNFTLAVLFFVCRSVSLRFFFFVCFYILLHHLVTKTTWTGLFGMYPGV